MRDHYAVLGVPPTATTSEIRAAHRRLALELHPDRHGTSEGAGPDTSARMAEVNEAARVLTDPARRRAYDAQRRPVADPPTSRPPTATTWTSAAHGDAVPRGPVSLTASLAGVLPWLALVGLLFGIFVFTAFAGGPGSDDDAGDERGVDQSPATVAVRDLRGQCVQLAAGFTLVVNCATVPHEGRIVVQGSIGAACPEPTIEYVVEQQDALVCVEPGTAVAGP